MADTSLLPEGGEQPPAGNTEQSAQQEQNTPPEKAPAGTEQGSSPEPRYVEFKGEKIEVPEHFQGEGDDPVNTPALLKAFNDTKTQLDKINNKRAPEKYEVVIPESFKDRVSEDAPLLSAAQEFGKAQNWSNEDLNATVEFYLEAENQIAEQVRDAELGAIKEMYGETTETTLKAVDDWGKAAILNNDKLPQEEREPLYQAMRMLGSTAAGVRLADYLRSGYLSGHIQEAKIPGANMSSGGSAMDENTLREMQADPKYWRDQDPAFIKKVEEGWKKLYPG